MLKLLLGHWQVHREPAPFVLTDDPLYCAHLSTSVDKLPEVYSVNRVNPLFEEDEGEVGVFSHKRTLSENDTRSSDDTGYISAYKSLDCNDSLEDRMSSDSDEPVKSVIVSADVHRESNPEDIILVSSDSSSSFGTRSFSSQSSTEEPYDSLTTTNATTTDVYPIVGPMKLGVTEQALQTEVKRPVIESERMNSSRENVRSHLDVRTSSDSSSSSQAGLPKDQSLEKTKTALMNSLTRVLNQKKLIKQFDVANTLTKTDSTTREKRLPKISETLEAKSSQDNEKDSSETEDMMETVTRRDESTTASSNSVSRPRRHRHHHHNRHRDTNPKPISLHQLLPGHWSYDNLYLPQMPGICYHCLHHNQHGGSYPLAPVPEMGIQQHSLYHHNQHKGRSRHSWAPRSISPDLEETTPTTSKDGTSTEDSRCSPDGSSQESDSQPSSDKLRSSAQERRSLRVPKKCNKCNYSSTFGKEDDLLPRTMPHACTCCYIPNRKVKFASDSDLTRHDPHKEMPHRFKEGIIHKAASVDKLKKATFPINLHRLNGHVKQKTLPNKEDNKTKLSTISRGKKEPIKMDELYRSYPINFQDWEAHYRRKFLNKRRKRALNMMAMAIGILFVIGVAIAMTFILLKLKRPT